MATGPEEANQVQSVLHLIEPSGVDVAGRAVGSDCCTLLCGQAMRATPTLAHRVWVLGGSEARTRAEWLGLHVQGQVRPLLGMAERSARTLRQQLRQERPADVVHAWSEGAWRAARAAETFGLVGTALTMRDDAGAELRLWPGSDEELASIGSAAPPVRDRTALRNGLQVGQDEVLVALLAESTVEADARPLLWAMTMLHLVGVPAVGLVPAQSRFAGAARTLARGLRCDEMLVEVAEPTVGLLDGADVAVIPGTVAKEAARVLALAALARGVPVAAHRAVAPAGAPEDMTYFLRGDTPQDIAEGVSRLHRGASRTPWRLARRADGLMRLWNSAIAARMIDA